MNQLQKIIHDTKGIIFDYDGTIADTMPVWCKAYGEYVSSFDVYFDEKAYSASVNGMHIDDATRAAMKLTNQPDEKLSEVVEFVLTKFSAFIDHVKLVAGVRDFISQLKVPFAIATGGEERILKEQVRYFDFLQKAQSISFCNEVKAPKPDPAVYHAALQKLGLSASEVVVFEDSLPGLKAAKAAGCVTVCVMSDISDELEKKAIADFVINDYRCLFDCKMNK